MSAPTPQRAPLRVALIRQRYTPFGGAERFVDNALAALREQTDIRLTLITRRWEGADIPGVERVICNPFHIGRLWRDWSFARCACRAVRAGGFDLVQSHERVPCGDIYRAGDGVHREWLRQRARVIPAWKRWLTRLSPYHRYLLWQERRNFERPDLRAVIVNSSLTAREIGSHFPPAGGKVHVIHNAVDCERFSPALQESRGGEVRRALGIPAEARVLLFLGSGFERKGVPLLLRVMAGLPEDIHLIVAGKDRRLTAFRQAVERAGLAGRVHLVGPVEEPAAYYAEADLFVFPSLYDPLPNSVLEAMASALPVIVSATCGAGDLITPGGEGHVLDPLDEAAWRRAIVATLEPGRRQTMGTSARRRALELTPQSLAARLSGLYREIIDPAGTPRA